MHRQADISAQIVQVILNHQVLKIATKKRYSIEKLILHLLFDQLAPNFCKHTSDVRCKLWALWL